MDPHFTNVAADLSSLFAGMADGARSTGAVGVSFFGWTAAVSTGWPRTAGYDGRGTC